MLFENDLPTIHTLKEIKVQIEPLEVDTIEAPPEGAISYMVGSKTEPPRLNLLR